MQMELEFAPTGADVQAVPAKCEEPAPYLYKYRELKVKHPDAVLLFRGGDYYVTFYEDAQLSLVSFSPCSSCCTTYPSSGRTGVWLTFMESPGPIRGYTN